MEREVTVSIGAEITGVRGADVLNRQVQTLEQSTANSLARLQNTAGRMTTTGTQMSTAWQKAEASFQSMQQRAGQWAGNIERTWGAFSSRLQGLQTGMQSAASGAESLAKAWTIFTGSEEDLTKMIKKLMTINAFFDSIRGSAALFSGLKDIAITVAGGTAGAAASSAGGSAVGSAVGSALGTGGAMATPGAIRWVRSFVPASAAGGVGASSVLGWGAGMSGGAGSAAGGSAAGAVGVSTGLIAAGTIAAISLAILGSRDFANFLGRRTLGNSYADSALRLFDPSAYGYGRDLRLNHDSDSNVETMESRRRLSRRMQRETGISLFEVESLDDYNYQFRQRMRERTEPLRQRIDEMRTVMPIQFEVEGRNRLRQMQIADMNRDASRLTQFTTRGDATAATFRNSWEANVAAGRASIQPTPLPERVANDANIQRMEAELRALNQRAAGLQYSPSPRPYSGPPSHERTWGQWAGSWFGYHQIRTASARVQQPQTNFTTRGTGSGMNPLQELAEIDRRRNELASQLAEARQRSVQLSTQEREQVIQTLAAERQRFQQLHEFHRDQAQALRDQQRSQAGSFGFTPVDEQQRMLRIAQAISQGNGRLLSPEDIQFGRGQEILAPFLASEGRRRAGEAGIMQQIDNLAPPGELSRNRRIQENERQAALAAQTVAQVQVALTNNIQLQAGSVAREIDQVLRPAFAQMIRTVTETLRQEMKLEEARRMMQQGNQQQQGQAAGRAAAGNA